MAASEIKLVLDLKVTPLLTKYLSELTDEQFEKVYNDVRIYPQEPEIVVPAWTGKTHLAATVHHKHR